MILDSGLRAKRAGGREGSSWKRSRRQMMMTMQSGSVSALTEHLLESLRSSCSSFSSFHECLCNLNSRKALATPSEQQWTVSDLLWASSRVRFCAAAGKPGLSVSPDSATILPLLIDDMYGHVSDNRSTTSLTRLMLTVKFRSFSSISHCSLSLVAEFFFQ